MALGEKRSVVMEEEKAVPGGVATLGPDGVLSESQRPSLGQIKGGSNPNLLDNCDFQIWQKYPNGIYTGVPYRAYITDRWIITSSDGSVENRIERVPGGGIANREGPAVVLGTRLENASDYNGKVMTLSCLKKEPGASDIALVSETAIATDWSSDTNILNSFDNQVGGIQWLLSGEEIYRYKLEIGPVQTLAHKEGGTWVLNDPPPNKTLELAKCQRYQFNLGGAYTAFGDNGNSQLFLSVPNHNLRTSPTISGVNVLWHRTNGVQSVLNSEASVVGVYLGKDRLNFILDIPGGQFSVGQAVQLAISSGLVDANL